MNIDDALSLINEIQRGTATFATSGGVYSAKGKNWISSKADFDKANNTALDSVADEAVKMVKQFLSTPYPPSSLPGQAPHMRTGTLKDSIHWRRGRASRQFPGPAGKSIGDLKRFIAKNKQEYDWYKKIKREAYQNNQIINPYPRRDRNMAATRVIEVDPKAVDQSEGRRLEYYSYFLETGWYSRASKQFLDKGKGSNTGSVYSGRKPKKTNGPKWNPPRPYLSRLTYPAYKQRLEQVYKLALRNALPAGLKFLADRATLTITYNRSLRVPFISGNQHLLR